MYGTFKHVIEEPVSAFYVDCNFGQGFLSVYPHCVVAKISLLSGETRFINKGNVFSFSHWHIQQAMQ